MNIEQQLRNRRTLDVILFWLAGAAVVLSLDSRSWAACLPMVIVALTLLVMVIFESSRIGRLRRQLSFAEIKLYSSGLIRRDVQ